MEKEGIKKKGKSSIIFFIILSFVFAIPSIIYIIQNKTIYSFRYVWTYFFRIPTTANEKIVNAIIFWVIFTLLFLLYIVIVKKRKAIFNSKKSIFILIVIVSLLFAFIIPYTSLDVYSYIANGWAAAHYGENPYYVSTGEIVNNTGQNELMFNKVANSWRYETVVYGPLWTGICTVLSYFSFGNIDIALLIFKIANLIVHLINCVLVYKITRRKIFLILYGLNPFILFEALSNVHNDIFIILFILLAIYFTIRKKNLFIAVAFIALATAIKYLAILVLPFIVIYYVRKKDVKNRIKYCIICGIEYVVIISLLYLIYMQDLSVFEGILTQQGKYNRSIFYILYRYLEIDIVEMLQNVCLGIFAIFYVYICIRFLLQKQIRFRQAIKKYNVFLLIFTFILITNFNPWYIMWLFPTMFWLKGKSQGTILAFSYSCEIANLMSFALRSEKAWLGIPYLIIMIVGVGVVKLLAVKMKKEESSMQKKNSNRVTV